MVVLLCRTNVGILNEALISTVERSAQGLQPLILVGQAPPSHPLQPLPHPLKPTPTSPRYIYDTFEWAHCEAEGYPLQLIDGLDGE